MNTWIYGLLFKNKGYQQTLFDLMFEEEEKKSLLALWQFFLDPILSPELKNILKYPELNKVFQIVL